MACASPSPADHPEVPTFVQGWVRSLLDVGLLDLLRDAGDRQVEVRLYASKGRVRLRPAVLIDVSGQHAMVDPADIG